MIVARVTTARLRTLTRIRLRVGDAFGLWSPWTELTPTPAATVAAGPPCDPDSRARPL